MQPAKLQPTCTEEFIFVGAGSGAAVVGRGAVRVGGLLGNGQQNDVVLNNGCAAIRNPVEPVIRNPARQVRLWRMIQFDKTEVIPLDGSQAQAVAGLLARTGTSDITNAHVVICVQTAGYAVITSDPRDLKRLDPALRLIRI